jgi:simple sugar transport system permease protein
MTVGASPTAVAGAADQVESFWRGALQRGAAWLDEALLPAVAFAVSLGFFGVFVALSGHSPIAVFEEMYRGAFGTWFSFQNTLLRAAPLMLTGLCCALPARLGLIMIGGEGAVVVGGTAAAVVPLSMTAASPLTVTIAMMLAGMAAGAIWTGLAGTLRALRGVNETISSLLLSYIAIALMNHLVEGPLKDPASLNKPSTAHIGDANLLTNIPGFDVHWGLVYGIVACFICYLLMDVSTFGFSSRIVGGNPRAARLSGLGVKKLIIVTCALAGAFAGLAGMVEVAAVHGRANASLIAGYGYTGILVAFLARHNPLAIIPVSLLLGGISASGGLLQRTFGLPDATVNVMQGILFVVLLASETYRGKVKLFGRFAEAS